MALDIEEYAVNRWADSVPAKELEANVVMLAHQPDAQVPISFQDGWRTSVPARLIVEAAKARLS